MRATCVTVASSLLLLAGPVLAQTPAPGQATPAPAAQAPAPAAQAPAPAAQAPAPKPFPEGAKVAFLNIQRLAAESAEGKAATTKVKALNDRKVQELAERNKNMQAAQQKLQQSGGVLSDAARGQLEKDIEKMQVEIQRFTQDAQAEVNELQQELQAEFQRKLIPVINAVATERGLHMVFSQADSGLVWADTGLDITLDVVRRFDAAVSAAPAAKP
jgi:outer membrane protein